MEYSVGSLAELISGINAPNKPNVVVKQFKQEKKTQMSPTRPNLRSTDTHNSPSKKKYVKRLMKPPSASTTEVKSTVWKGTPKKKGVKRQLEPSENGTKTTETLSPPKKQKLSKNNQNAANRIKNKKNQETKSSGEYNNRTVFVGNIPIGTKKQKIKKFFKKYGEIESVRFRGIPVKDIKTPKKVAAIKKEFHPDRDTLYAFIRFKNAKDAKKAESSNGDVFEDHHLRVQCCKSNEKHDETKAIFIGNLCFDAEEENLWNLFSPCGAISHVRIVRDGRTGMGKGFGYINFKDSDAVQLALEMEKVMVKNRELRISLCNTAKAKKRRVSKDVNVQKNNSKPKVKTEKEPLTKKVGKEKFSGSKFTDKKKKKKISKDLKAKKRLAEKLVAVKKEKVEV